MLNRDQSEIITGGGLFWVGIQILSLAGGGAHNFPIFKEGPDFAKHF